MMIPRLPKDHLRLRTHPISVSSISSETLKDSNNSVQTNLLKISQSPAKVSNSFLNVRQKITQDLPRIPHRFVRDCPQDFPGNPNGSLRIYERFFQHLLHVF